jgi:carbon-monoxide dehydrogenase small subunit
MHTKKIRFTLNETAVKYEVPVHWTLGRLLRQGKELTGTKESCGEGECGSCTVIVDGHNVNSCLMMAVDADGCEITTIEGLKRDGELHPLQKAFIAKGAIQCGFCTPGMILSSKVLLDNQPAPTREEIRKALAGNICRCTGYDKIFEAVESVAHGEVHEISAE